MSPKLPWDIFVWFIFSWLTGRTKDLQSLWSRQWEDGPKRESWNYRPASVWRVLQDITNYRRLSFHTAENWPTTWMCITAGSTCEEVVRQVFKRQKTRKAPGPDGASPSCLNVCADQLAHIFTQIFNRSLELCEVPSCFKCSTIIPVPKKFVITGKNDYRSVTLTSVVKKSFKRLLVTSQAPC